MTGTQNTWYTIRAAAPRAEGETRAEVLIYGDIGESWWGESITAAQFVKDLAAIDASAITVRINSYGGSVTDGIAIHNAMRRHAAQIDVEIDGTAYSIASLIAMAGDTVRMADNAMLMIHAPWTFASGNAVELRDVAGQLDQWAEAMVSSYARRTGDEKAVRALLTDGKDHFFSAAEAQELGYVDEVVGAMPLAAHAISRAAFAERIRAAAKTEPVSQPAAAAAQSKGVNMTETVKEPAADVNAAVQAALAADQQRRATIRANFAPFAAREGVAALQAQCEDDAQVSVETAGLKLLAVLAKSPTPTAGSHIVTVEDEADKRRAAMSNAMLAMAGLEKADSANPMAGHRLIRIANAEADRLRLSGDDSARFGRLLAMGTTSDFGFVLKNVANKAMLKGYEEADETFQRWTRAGTLTDYKQGWRVGLNPFDSLPPVAEGAEYTYGTLSDRGTPVVISKYGKLFAITREAIINDDLDAFTRIPRLMGRAAVRTVGDLVYAVLTGNPNMPDNDPLFHANHGNLPSAAAISTASVQAMRAAMATQKLGSTALNIQLKYLIVPQKYLGLAETLRRSEVAIPFTDATIPNIVANTFEVIADARLDAAANTNWFGAADPNLADTIEVNYLNGNQAPTLEEKDGWNVDGVEFKVRIEAGVAPLDFRGLAKNAGA